MTAAARVDKQAMCSGNLCGANAVALTIRLTSVVMLATAVNKRETMALPCSIS